MVNVRKLYWFRANAVGVAAVIRRSQSILSRPAILSSQAASNLSSIGGRSEGSAGPTVFRNGLIQFESARTLCSGDYEDSRKAAGFTRNNWDQNSLTAITKVEAAVGGLKVVNKGPESRREFKVARMNFEMLSINKRNGKEPEVSIKPGLQGIEIDGQALRVKFVDDDFLCIATLEGLKSEYEKGKAFFKRFGTCFFPPGSLETPHAPAKRFPISAGLACCTIVDSIEWAKPKEAPRGAHIIGRNRIQVDGFGTILLGELRVTCDSKSISMARIYLGSPAGGEAESLFAQDNGGNWPPP